MRGSMPTCFVKASANSEPLSITRTLRMRVRSMLTMSCIFYARGQVNVFKQSRPTTVAVTPICWYCGLLSQHQEVTLLSQVMMADSSSLNAKTKGTSCQDMSHSCCTNIHGTCPTFSANLRPTFRPRDTTRRLRSPTLTLTNPWDDM